MTYRTRRSASNGSSYENFLCGAGSVRSSHPEYSDTINRTILVMWECTICGRLYVDSAADPDCMPTPPIKECVTSIKEITSRHFERLYHYGSIDSTARRLSSASKSTNCSVKAGHRRFDCGYAEDAVDEAALENVVAGKSKGTGPAVMVGVCLAFWGLLIIVASAP